MFQRLSATPNPMAYPSIFFFVIDLQVTVEMAYDGALPETDTRVHWLPSPDSRDAELWLYIAAAQLQLSNPRPLPASLLLSDRCLAARARGCWLEL